MTTDELEVDEVVICSRLSLPLTDAQFVPHVGAAP
jgi:hypothetical protein